MTKNLILNTDSYKASHYLQYPQNTEYLSSYVESRGGEFSHVIFFGLQAFIKEYLCERISYENISEAEEFFLGHGLPFNKNGWEHIMNKYGGYLPIEIEAIEEGTLVPTQNVLMQIINTDPKCFWLSTYLETTLLRAIWYPSTVATISFECKKVIKENMLETCDNLDGLDFKLHDFGARGASSNETAALGGMAHLINFKGSDTIAGVLAARKYYSENMAAFSIPASEHSTIIAYGKQNESDAYKNILNAFSGEGKAVAVVSDSYDLWNAIDNVWGGTLHNQVKQNKGTLVIRPDSGNPLEVVPQVIEMLMYKFGYTINSKGYKVLPPFLRVIQGDGVCLESIKKILIKMKNQKLSADNITFGMGASLLQKLNRDTMLFAMKASAIYISGKWHNIAKTPITDVTKSSKEGRLALIYENQKFHTVALNDLSGRKNYLKTVFRNGELLREEPLTKIRERTNSELI